MKVGTCGKCARIVCVLIVPGGMVVEAHEVNDSEVCAGSGLAPRGVLDGEVPALVADVEPDEDWGPTPAQEEAWDSREDWIRGNALG